jgi:hypothetical protein
MKEGKTTDEGVGEAFAFQPGPGPGGIDFLKVVAPMQLMRQFEVMEDSKDGLGNFHREWLLSSGNASR